MINLKSLLPKKQAASARTAPKAVPASTTSGTQPMTAQQQAKAAGVTADPSPIPDGDDQLNTVKNAPRMVKDMAKAVLKSITAGQQLDPVTLGKYFKVQPNNNGNGWYIMNPSKKEYLEYKSNGRWDFVTPSFRKPVRTFDLTRIIQDWI